MVAILLKEGSKNNMIHQPIPKISVADIERVIKRDFKEHKNQVVMDILNEYGEKDYQRERERVCLAVLKLSEGDLEKLRRNMDIAKVDYRDVLALAEYPNYIKAGLNMTDREKKINIDLDWKQYCDWLKQ